MCRHGELGFAGELFLDRFHDVAWEERLSVIFANVPVSDKAGFTAQITGKLAAEVVLDDDGVPRAL